jgi:hypothetical protein
LYKGGRQVQSKAATVFLAAAAVPEKISLDPHDHLR